MRHSRLDHRFVEHLPDDLDPGVLYISVAFGTASHSCCCGCGEEVVTPITPTDWRLTYDGETISLNPSVGNWSLACRSHYVIKAGRVIEAGPWSDEQIARERSRDQAAKARHYGNAVTKDHTAVALPPAPSPSVPSNNGLFDRIRDWFSVFGKERKP